MPSGSSRQPVAPAFRCHRSVRLPTPNYRCPLPSWHRRNS